MPLQITYITSAETIDLRHLALRQGRPKSSSHMEGDDLKSTKHIGAFINSECVGILSLFEAKIDDHLDEYQYQLRGMAVHPKFQGQEIGKKLIEFAEHELRKMQVNLLWCNARSSAANFYDKLNFEIISEEFHIPDVGPHFVMCKKLR
ncbi:GNAT family N-acetyltransferase [Psychroflexus montanilacus]|uniref:GNAT family N-acetyltransferase n=1 Tax=Psychroflexus montanilacus TaxID=2873598 RepID=UPI001CCA0A9F|nr:GNAT family N-acetyltransferase [Psychroflexus montanilacus]MBZ9651293.1 GNAT family N-acetyltransferase [Psychroflexus montanilacus]